MYNDFNMPNTLAANQEQFNRLFRNIRNNDWNNCQGFALVHILAKDARDAMLVTRNGLKKNDEVRKLETEIAHLIKYSQECSIGRAYDILHRLYVPTESEYEYLCKREFGEDECNGYDEGVYDSVPPEQNGWFNFCLQKWNTFHNQYKAIDENDSTVRKRLREYSKEIRDEWDDLSPEEQQGWSRV